MRSVAFGQRVAAWWLGSLVVVGATLASAAEEPNHDLVQAVHVVRTFYKFHLSHDMGFTEDTVVKRKEWLSPDFYALLLAETRKPKDSGEAPVIEGDPFTDSQEYPNRFSTGVAKRTGEDEITVDVELAWVKKVREYRQYHWRREEVTREVDANPPRHMTVKLTRGQRLWRIADLISNDGKSLRGLLDAHETQRLPAKPPDWMNQPAAADPLAPPKPGEPAKPWQPSGDAKPWER